MTALRRPPYLRGTPGLGLAREIRRDALGVLKLVADECGGVGEFRIGPQRAMVVSSPEACRELLVERPDDFGKGRIQLRALRPVMGQGLLSSEGELHDRQRKLVLPHFTARRMARHVDLIAATAEEAIGRWADGAEIDLLAEMNALTMDVVGRLVFSIPMREERRLAQAITDIFEWEMYAITNPLAVPIGAPLPRCRRARAAVAVLRDRIRDLVRERRQPGAADPGDILSLLVAARYEDGTPMPDRQLQDEVFTTWGASLETSADAQTWTLYLLARHPEVYARLRSEVDGVLGDRRITADDVKRLPYALQVFKEAMRLYPPAASMLRTPVRDTRLAGYRVPRGTLLFVSPYALHRRADLFPDPERFDPDRFDRQREQRLPKHAYLPFGAGRTSCVGSHLALLEGQVLTATLAQRLCVELSRPEPVEPVLMINLRPRDVVRARVFHRDPAPLSADLTEAGR